MLAGLVHGMVDSAYFEPDLALVFWWLIAVVLLAHAETQCGARSRHVDAVPAAGSAHANGT
jgi:hypothetical protein